jgi:hypothetical protein
METTTSLGFSSSNFLQLLLNTRATIPPRKRRVCGLLLKKVTVGVVPSCGGKAQVNIHEGGTKQEKGGERTLLSASLDNVTVTGNETVCT